MNKENESPSITKLAATATRILVITPCLVVLKEIAKHRLKIGATIPLGKPEKKDS